MLNAKAKAFGLNNYSKVFSCFAGTIQSEAAQQELAPKIF